MSSCAHGYRYGWLFTVIYLGATACQSPTSESPSFVTEASGAVVGDTIQFKVTLVNSTDQIVHFTHGACAAHVMLMFNHSALWTDGVDDRRDLFSGGCTLQRLSAEVSPGEPYSPPAFSGQLPLDQVPLNVLSTGVLEVWIVIQTSMGRDSIALDPRTVVPAS